MKCMRSYNRVCPPLKARCIVPPVRAFWPLVPRPAVLPRPEPCPRPTRRSRLCDPGAGRKSDSFIFGYFLFGYFLYPYQVTYFTYHATHSRMISMFNSLLKLTESQRADRRFLILWIP